MKEMILAFSVGFIAIGLTVALNSEETPTREQIYPDCQGKIGEKCEIDTVYYDQHPQKKCWHLHYENR